MQKWALSELLHKKVSKDSLAIEWAYTGTRIDCTGKTVPNVLLAKGLLLASYNDSFGEYPPWNQKE